MFDSHSRHRDTKSKEKINLILMVMLYLLFSSFTFKKKQYEIYLSSFFSILTNALIYECYGND